jgi:uncharacterized protein (TIGR02646 family)
MIRIRKKAASPVPHILQSKGRQATASLKDQYNNGERDFGSKDFDKTIYGNKEVKEALISIQDGKCCFCESKILHISHGDVEHFRPKAGWVQSNENLNKPGYYWLAYEWDNLLLSCEICNQRHKKNVFPLVNNSLRALSHFDNINTEQAVFINPAIDDPEQFITFKEEVPVAVHENSRGNETILKLGLDRETLNEQRRTKLNLIRDIYDLAKGYPDIDPQSKQQAKTIIQRRFEESQLDLTEYASMLRSFFRDNPIDFQP